MNSSKSCRRRPGFPEAQAKQAAQAVIDFLKTKLAPIAQQLDAVLACGGLGDALKGFGIRPISLLVMSAT